MFARTIIALLAMIPPLAAATAVPRTTTPTTPASQCIAGDLLCCESTEEASDFANDIGLESLLGLLGVDLLELTGLIGLTCSPIDIITVGGNSCAANPVCCSNNSFNGIVAVGCTPVDLNL